MDEKLPAGSLPSSLCTNCGLCCDGVLFDRVPIADDERVPLSRLGFDIQKVDGRHSFAQPCLMFDGQYCTVYSNRPVRCRRYRCELFKKVDAGEVSLSAALDRVAQAKKLIEQIRPMLQGGSRSESVGRQWQARFREWQTRAPEQRAAGSEARLVLQMTLLNRFLDRHFRSEKHRRVMEE